MAKDGNTYAKRQRETLKRQKAEEKRVRRQKRKDSPPAPDVHAGSDDPDAPSEIDGPREIFDAPREI